MGQLYVAQRYIHEARETGARELAGLAGFTGRVRRMVRRSGRRTAPGAARTARRPATGRRAQISRRSAAQRVSWCRVDSCSLRSTEETWVSTVRAEIVNSLAISL
jgi:hypothetical protein